MKIYIKKLTPYLPENKEHREYSKKETIKRVEKGLHKAIMD